jgi:hypothetical protein
MRFPPIAGISYALNQFLSRNSASPRSDEMILARHFKAGINYGHEKKSNLKI